MALGAICCEFRSNKGLGYKTYTKLFHTGVTPNLEKVNTVQNRAIRYVLGTHRFSPNFALDGDMGWSSTQTRWGWKWVDCGIDWLIWKMIVSLKNVFMWDKSLCKRNWSYEIKQLFSNNGFENTFMTNSCVNVKLMHDVLH